MQNESTMQVPREGSVSPFYGLSLRNLLLWYVVSIPIVIASYVLLKPLFERYFTDPIFGELCIRIWLYGVAFLWVLRHGRKAGLHSRFLFGSLVRARTSAWQLILVVPLFLFSVGALILLYAALAHIAPNFAENMLTDPSAPARASTSFPILFTVLDGLSLLVLAPVVEEYLFRGIMLHRLQYKWGIAWALAVVSLAFGLLHVDALGGIMFALVLGVVYIKTKTLWLPILLHALNNLIPFLNSFDQTRTDPSATEVQNGLLGGLVFIAFSLPFLIWFFRKQWPSKSEVMPYAANEAQSAKPSMI